MLQKKISKSFPNLSFIITVTGGNSMECKIVEKPAFHLVGISKRVPMRFEVVNASYNADTDFLKEEGDLTHLIGVLTTNGDTSTFLEKMKVESCTWAVFPNEGPFPVTLQNTMARIYAEWLPSSDYEVINVPSFSFTKMDENKKNYAYSEVWTPVRKK